MSSSLRSCPTLLGLSQNQQPYLLTVLYFSYRSETRVSFSSDSFEPVLATEVVLLRAARMLRAVVVRTNFSRPA